MTTEFRKSKNSEAYFVIVDGLHVGAVRKISSWTVRGDLIIWRAFKCGKSVGRDQKTRKAAAAQLTQ